MKTVTGWLLDAYPVEDGLKLWILAEGSPARLGLVFDFPVTFYAAGDFATLRAAWQFLKDKGVTLERATKRDLFSGDRETLAITVKQPLLANEIFHELQDNFPELDYYNADIPVSLRFTAKTSVYLLGKCSLKVNGERVISISPLDDPWQLEPEPLPLRILTLSPDVDPAFRAPGRLRVIHEHADYCLSLQPFRAFEIALQSTLRQFDPDLILTDFGDTWLFPKLSINPNRDPGKSVLVRKADSYFAYGQVVYRGAQAHLFGRWHIDRKNAMLFGEYGLEGVLEQARVTGLGVQEMARKSPGAGITAMQILTALRQGVLVPVVKQQAEDMKTLADLVAADKGGLIYQPLIGIHKNVAQVDFASMYPSIMVKHNISPETTGKPGAPEGLVPQTLRPLLEKRLALKRLVNGLDARDCRVPLLKARAAALKWLLVVCFGYLGYKNARFGKIESHEAVTGDSRELMLQAKEAAEALDFMVIHMYVDCLFVQKEGAKTTQDFDDLLLTIAAQTGIPMALEGVYKWVAFLPSQRDERVPVPNRYFGVFNDGEIKARGIALRRHDACPFVAGVQLGILQILAKADDPRQKTAEAQAFVSAQLAKLREGRIPLDDLLVSQKLSREVEAYRVPSPAALAGKQLMEMGVQVRPGMRMRFWFVHGGVKVADVTPGEIDVKRYRRLVELAAGEVLGELMVRGDKPSAFL